MKFRIKLLGITEVDKLKYDFHITPVLTYTNVIHPSGSWHRSVALEWGHWAIVFGFYKLTIN